MQSKKLTSNELKEVMGASASVTAEEDDFTVSVDPMKKKRRGRKKKENYINPEIFKNQILQYYSDGIVTNDLCTSINNIATRLGFAPNFINYTYKEEMIGDAVIKMLHALKNKKFNPDKGNPFSYYTKIAFNAFRNRIKKEKRNHEAIFNHQTEIYETLINSGNMPNDHVDDSTGETDNDY